MAIEMGAKVSSLFTISLERRYRHPIGEVWAAISDEKHVALWMEYPARITPVFGGDVLIDFSPEEPIRGVVCAAETERLLAYTWGDSIVKWELSRPDETVRLDFSHVAVKREFLTGLCAGWHCFLDNLDAHLAGRPFQDRFEELHLQYEEHIGKEWL